MIVGGVVAGQGEISLLVLIAITWACAVAGDLASYTAGRKLGRAWLLRHGERLKITEDRLEQVERFFEKRGGVTILIGRFIGFVRALAPFIAGTSRMPLRRFLPYDVLGAGAWAATFATLGYVFWHSFDQLTTYVSRGLFAFATVVVVVGGVRRARAAAARPGEAPARPRMARRAARPPGWRLVIRVAGPAWRLIGRPASAVADLAARFGVGRLTPGGLGLELTTLLALLAVGDVLVLLHRRHRVPAGRAADRRAGGRPRGELAMDPLIEVAKVVTELGSFPVVALVALATVAWTLLRRRWIDAATLIVGVALSPLLVGVAKAAYDRDAARGRARRRRRRRLSVGPHRLLGRARRLRRRARPRRRGLGGALRGGHGGRRASSWWSALTRVYLRVHYLTDVLGGAALGVALWSLLGTLALVAGYVRHNEGPDR